MAEDPTKMVYRVIGTRLNGNTDAVAVYASYVPEDKVRPYILMKPMSDIERNFHRRKQDPDMVLLVKAVSLDESEALDIRQQVIELLDDQGEQDLKGLDGGADWHLLKAMIGERLETDYPVGSSRVFEKSVKVRITLEEA